MKKAYFIGAIVALSVIASTTPASALSLGLGADSNATIQYKSGSSNVSQENSFRADADRDDDQDENRTWTNDDKRTHDALWKSWAFNGNIAGTVTAKSGDSLTVKSANGATYTVDASGANIRYVMSGDTTISVGDRVVVQGVMSGSTVVATRIIDADAKTEPKANDDEKRMGIAGTVTATSGTTLTVLGKNGTTYTVSAANATVWDNKHESTTLSSVDEGDTVVVQGTISGSSVTAAKIFTVRLPKANADGSISGTVTAKSGDTLTVLATNGTTYTVDASDSDINEGKNDDATLDDIKVGDTVSITGDTEGSSIDADVITETHAKYGFFRRFGDFIKHLFSKKGDAKFEANGSVNY